MQGVYLEVFLPIIEQVLADQLWIFSGPALWLYRLTFGRLVRLVIKMLPNRAMDSMTQVLEEADLETTAGTIAERMSVVADQETSIVAALHWTQNNLNTIG
ncbi:MAG: hypothetical protein AAFN70_00740, partial [Planctomycetota bacterium]